MPYSVLNAQEENPITASWQCSQLYNFKAFVFHLWGNILCDILYLHCICIRGKCCNHTKFAFIPLMTKRIGQQIGIYDLEALQCKYYFWILLPLVEQIGSAWEVGLDQFRPWFKAANVNVKTIYIYILYIKTIYYLLHPKLMDFVWLNMFWLLPYFRDGQFGPRCPAHVLSMK